MEQKLAEVQERLEKYKDYQQVIADFPGIVIEVVADKGYENTEDMAECLEKVSHSSRHHGPWQGWL